MPYASLTHLNAECARLDQRWQTILTPQRCQDAATTTAEPLNDTNTPAIDELQNSTTRQSQYQNDAPFDVRLSCGAYCKMRKDGATDDDRPDAPEPQPRHPHHRNANCPYHNNATINPLYGNTLPSLALDADRSLPTIRRRLQPHQCRPFSAPAQWNEKQSTCDDNRHPKWRRVNCWRLLDCFFGVFPLPASLHVDHLIVVVFCFSRLIVEGVVVVFIFSLIFFCQKRRRRLRESIKNEKQSTCDDVVKT